MAGLVWILENGLSWMDWMGDVRLRVQRKG